MLLLGGVAHGAESLDSRCINCITCIRVYETSAADGDLLGHEPKRGVNAIDWADLPNGAVLQLHNLTARRDGRDPVTIIAT